MNKSIMKRMLLLLVVFAGLFCVSAAAAEEDWVCESCGTVNAAKNNFCSNCGSARPEENREWTCPECGNENEAEFNFCVNCGAAKPSAGQSETEAASGAAAEPYAYGLHMLHWDGYIYTTGDDGVYRIDSSNQFDRIVGNNSMAYGIFATGNKVYFIKHDVEGGNDYLYRYDIDRDDAEVLCTAKNGSLLIGADEKAAYFLQPSGESDYNDGNDLIRYHLAEDEKETVASGIGTAQFWNGGIVITGAASDVSPVQMIMLGSDGNSGLVGENCSQNFYIDGNSMYYIKYNMTSDTSWDAAYICCLDETGNREFLAIEGDYITPGIVGMVSDNVVISFYKDGKLQYIQANPSDGSWYEMELPEGASSISIYYDEYGNRYYYANYGVYIWKGSEYRKVADISTDGVMLGVSGSYAFCWRYNNGRHPSLFQFPIS